MLQRITGNQHVLISQIQNSTITVAFGSRQHRAVPLEPAWFELPPGVTSPARLLRARYAVVPYLPPGDLSEQLAAWCHGRQPFGLLILAGTAGAGKTRIAVELCRSLSELHWLTGLLKSKVDPEQLDLLAETPTPRLVVVDYAETRHEQLAELLPVLAGRASEVHPVRVLLTIRSRAVDAEAVRRALYGRGDALDMAIDSANVDLLSELPFGERERGHLFESAVEVLSRRLERDPEPARRLTPRLSDPTMSTALMVLIAAYLAVEDGRVPATRTELLDGLLDHEDRYWSQTAAGAGVGSDQTLRRRVVALATLAGAGPSETETTAAGLLRLVPDLRDASERDRRELARWAHHLYPGIAWWNPVEPDLIGEHLVATTYGNESAVLAGAITDRPPDALVQPLRLLARAARDHPSLAHTLSGVVNERLDDLCRAAIEQASGADAPRLLQVGATLAAALEPLVSAVPPDPDQLPGMLDGFPWFNTVLDHLVLTLTSQLAGHYRRLAAANPAAFEHDLARVLNNLGIRLSALGEWEQALDAIQEAVEISRRLAAANPAAFEPNLAMALNSLCVRLSALGRREQALDATQEAVEIYRRLATGNPAAFAPDLAGALNNLGLGLSNLGRREQALAAAEEAVVIRRRLAADNPAAFEHDLATALNNLSVGLSNLGRREQALAAAEEAVEIHRRLAAANPAAFEYDLATALNNLSTYLSNLGRSEQALAATEEAVELYRRLATANPAAFEPDLARALSNISVDLSNLGRREHAQAAAEEAVQSYRRLAAANPDAFEPNLAIALNNFSNRLSNLGRPDEALAATEEAVEIYRRLAADNSAAFEPNLATALSNLSIRLGGLHRRDGAIAAIEEAIDIWRRLVVVHPEVFAEDFEGSLKVREWLLGLPWDRPTR